MGILICSPLQEDEFFDDNQLPMDEIYEHQSTRSSNMNTSRNSYRGGGVPVFYPNGSSTPSKPPSVVGSVDGYRVGHGGNPYRPQRIKELNPQYTPKRPGSVTGSIEGRLATSKGGRRSHQQGRFKYALFKRKKYYYRVLPCKEKLYLS